MAAQMDVVIPPLVSSADGGRALARPCTAWGRARAPAMAARVSSSPATHEASSSPSHGSGSELQPDHAWRRGELQPQRRCTGNMCPPDASISRP